MGTVQMKLIFILLFFITFDVSAIPPTRKIIYYSNINGGPFETLELCEAKNFPSGAGFIKGECTTYKGVVNCEALDKNTRVRISYYSCQPQEIYVCPDGTSSSKGGVCQSKCPAKDTIGPQYPYNTPVGYRCEDGCIVEVSRAVVESGCWKSIKRPF